MRPPEKYRGDNNLIISYKSPKGTINNDLFQVCKRLARSGGAKIDLVPQPWFDPASVACPTRKTAHYSILLDPLTGSSRTYHLDPPGPLISPCVQLPVFSLWSHRLLRHPHQRYHRYRLRCRYRLRRRCHRRSRPYHLLRRHWQGQKYAS